MHIQRARSVFARQTLPDNRYPCLANLFLSRDREYLTIFASVSFYYTYHTMIPTRFECQGR